MADTPKKPPALVREPWMRYPPEAYSEVIECEFTDEELVLVEAKAAEVGLSVEAYLRLCALGVEGSA